ncbi:TIGR03086 family metal-binding protein [Microlunatus sp. Gsoil 973]|jgi:uncharacterized protein (TIGR03086 family)|uniref:TIGR03086 family metal-binding protein n=1 Tax=Microlunatus sp. Gsoil 973 TaxID=2672569 RepID=UPI0012B4EDF4|nr:TIGR03086 family metal-binding protein [Microlunatus sp. Gsoil 973]QGN33916.1 TIGR03086 family protein [Microlunatus sp. Gsoil 973]
MDLISAASIEIERVVRQLPAASWPLPTPIGLTVRELVEHVVSGNEFTALLLAGVGRDEARAKLSGDPLADDPGRAVAESCARQAEAFAAVPPDRLIPGPGGEVPAGDFLLFRLIDLVVHGWDLLHAAGLDEALDPAVVSELWVRVEPGLPELLAYGAYGEGPSGTIGPDAPVQTRLLDALGRRP